MKLISEWIRELRAKMKEEFYTSAAAEAEVKMWKRPLVVCHWCEEPVPEEEYCTHWKTCENSPARAELADARRENERLREFLALYIETDDVHDLVLPWTNAAKAALKDEQVDDK